MNVGLFSSAEAVHYIIIVMNTYYARTLSNSDLSSLDHSSGLTENHEIDNINIKVHISEEPIPFI
jgi:hypothetical protein